MIYLGRKKENDQLARSPNNRVTYYSQAPVDLGDVYDRTVEELLGVFHNRKPA